MRNDASASLQLVVLYGGRIVGRVDTADADRDQLGLMMAGHTEVA